VTVSLAIGGAETQIVRLVNRLDRSRFKPSIICLREGGELAAAVAHDVPVAKPGHGGGGALRAMSVLVGELRRQKPDLVHAYLPAAYVPAAAVAWGLRVPVIVAGRRGLTSGGMYERAWWRTAARFADRVIDLQICNSKAVRDIAITKDGVRPERTRVIHNGIEVPAMDGIALPPEMVWDGPSAVMVANFIRYKGHANVLLAVARVVKRHPDFRLVLIGDGPERAALERLTSDLDLKEKVVFAGSRTDAAAFIHGFDFSILGSSEESLPNAIMESMALAVPVVATRVGGVDELVDDGVHGKLVPYGDVDAMAGAIAWMLEHPEARRRMGVAGRERIASDFSVERMVTQTEIAYEEYLAVRSKR
jgi:glycosyltransferase involved in cell wall biosynthesis